MGLLDNFKKIFSKQAPGPVKKKLSIVDVSKRFELLGRTGQGSMSKVWRARDKNTGRTICLKLLDAAKTAKFEGRFPGLLRPPEGEISMSLKHKNIVNTMEHGITTDKEPYIVMELVDGMGLNFLIENNSPNLIGHRIDYLLQLAEGIEFVHRFGYLHRDICPRNVMVNSEGVVKIIDFGLAIPLKPEFCKPGNRTGTPDYMAPELIKRQSTDQRVDMYALGVTAYEIFTGTLPWEKASSADTLRSHMNSPGKDPLEVNPDMPKELAAFLVKAIERDPRARFQNATAFKEAVKELPEGW